MYNCDQIRIYAYYDENISCFLYKHLFNTFVVFINTNLINRLRVIIKRLVYEDLLKCNESDVEALLLLSPLLHDIGKTLPVYQTRRTKKGIYTLHELFSGVITYKLLKHLSESSNKLVECPVDNYLIGLITYPILNHHYAMRDLDRKLHDGSVIEFLANSEIRFHDVHVVLNCLKDEIEKIKDDKRIVSRIESIDVINKIIGLLDFFCELTNSLSSSVNSIKLGSRDSLVKLYNLLIRELENTQYVDWAKQVTVERIRSIYISALTGLLNVADYLTGSIERSGVICSTISNHRSYEHRKIFVLNVISSDELKRVCELVEPC